MARISSARTPKKTSTATVTRVTRSAAKKATVEIDFRPSKISNLDSVLPDGVVAPSSPSDQARLTEFFAPRSRRGASTNSKKKLTSLSGNSETLLETRLTSPTKRLSSCQSLTTASPPKRTRKTTSKKTKKVVLSEVEIDFKPTSVRKLDFEQSGVESEFEKLLEKGFSKPEAVDDDAIPKVEEINNNNAKVLAVDEIKEKLKKCTKLEALKQQLTNINGCAEKLRRFKEIKVNCPVSDGQKKPTEPEPVPAYEKYAYLAAPKKPTEESKDTELTLPLKYQRLVEVFKKVDHYAWALFKRHESCTFEKLKLAVEQATRRTFTLDHLITLLCVSPDRPNHFFKLSRQIDDIEAKDRIIVTPVHQESVKCLNSVGTLLEREKEFRSLLLERTKQEHLKFLASMNLKLEAEKQIYRWHPMFPLDSVPDITLDRSVIPRKLVSTTKQTRVTDFFKARTLHDKEKEMSKVKSKEEEDEVVRNKVKSGKLKGISLDLLNKVRAKEAANLANRMTRPPEMEREIRDLGHLPDLIRILHSASLTTFKATRSIPFDDAIQRIIASINLNHLEADRLLTYLTTLDLAQPWIQVLSLNKARFLKIDRDYPLATIFRSIRHRLQQLQSS